MYTGVSIPSSATSSSGENLSTEAFTLLLPGTKLDISELVKSRKYKKKGNKAVLLESCESLEKKGLGKLLKLGSSRGTSMVSVNIIMVLCILTLSFHCKLQFCEDFIRFCVTSTL